MLTARRDTMRGGARWAIPSLGEIEGRMMVLEFVAITSLDRLFRLEGEQAADDLAEAMRRAIRIKCHATKLCAEDTHCAEDYVEELIDCARIQYRRRAKAQKKNIPYRELSENKLRAK
jgi:hypothetical protein